MKTDLSCFLQSKFNMYLYAFFGWHVTRILVFFFGMLYYCYHKQEKQLIEKAVFTGLGIDVKQNDIRKVIRSVFKGIYAHYYEKLFIAYETPENAVRFMTKNITDNDLGQIQTILNKGKGLLLVTGHFGAIEFIPTLLASKGFNVSMIAKFKTPHLKRKVHAQARKYGIRLIDGACEGGILKAAGKELNENRVLITQCDEIDEWRPSAKQTVSFLGRPTGLDRTINVIQKRTGAEVAFGIIHRYHLKNYEFRMADLHQMKCLLNLPDDASTGEALIRFLEKQICDSPEQWYQWKKYFAIGSDANGDRHSNKRKLRRSMALNPAFEGAR